MTVAVAWAVMQISLTAGVEPINLSDFARVVKYTGDSPETLQVQALERGTNGWPVWEGEAGQSMIGVEWDEPRDIAQAEIEFRHAIADREQIRVQYFHKNWPNDDHGGWAPLDDPFHGRWVTAKTEWWAGDRDVGFAMLPLNEERNDPEKPELRYRRSYRLRFVLGKREQDLPACRYLRIYGPGSAAEATLELRCEPGTSLRPPLDASVVNGYLLTAGSKTTTCTANVDGEPGKLLVRFFADDTQSPNRTIVTLRDPSNPLKGFSFLPAEVVARGSIHVPSLGVFVTHGEGTASRPSEARCVYDRVAHEPEQTFERARRDIPPMLKHKQKPQPLYIPLGPPDAQQEIAVSYDGSVYQSASSLKLPAEDDRRQWPAERWRIRIASGDPPLDHTRPGAIEQSLLQGYLPIVINKWEQQGVHYEQTCVATYLSGEPRAPRGDETAVLLVRIQAKNRSPGDSQAVIKLWSEPGEAWQQTDEGHVQAVGLWQDQRVTKYPKPRTRFFIKAHDGRVAMIDTQDGGLRWSCPLASGAGATLEYRVPFIAVEGSARAELAKLDFDTCLANEVQRWQKIIDQAAVMEVPEGLLSDFYKAQLAHILITADRDPSNGMDILPAGTFDYGVCLNEACHQVRSLEIRGLHQQAEKFLEAMLEGQSSRGLHGRFTSKQGVFHGLPTKGGDYQKFNYNLDHGFVLWMLNEHYRFTRDRDWLRRVSPQLIAACDFIAEERHSPPEADTLASSDDRWGRGLLPPGHLEDPPEWLWWFSVNAYAARGMRMTAESLAEIDDPQAQRIAREAADFDQCLRDSCRESMLRAPVVRLRDGSYVLFQPTRSRLRGRDLGWIRDALYGPVHLIDCGVYADDSPEAEWILRDSEDNVFISEERGRSLTDFERQWFSWGGITIQSNLLPNPLIYLRRGQREHAIRAFYNSLAANVFEDVRTFTEHPVEAYGLGQGPFFKSPDESAFIVWMRHLLICEKGEDLWLLAGAPSGWLQSGNTIHVQRAATWFGPMDLNIQSSEAPPQITCQIAGPTRNPPRSIRLDVGRPVRAVTIDGEPDSTFDPAKGIIHLPGGLPRVEIVISF